MANDKAILEKEDALEGLDFDALEKQLQENLESELSDLEFLDKQISQIGNPDALGDVILNTVWEQFTNQIAIQAGEDFVKSNNGMRLDLRDVAHKQTTENFAEGKIANHNTEIDYQKRYDDWQSNFQKDPNAKSNPKSNERYNAEKQVWEKYDNRSKSWKTELKKDYRKDIDADRPKGSKTLNKEHLVSAAENQRDPEVAAHMTREEQIAFLNSDKNLIDLDSAANQSKGDSKMTDWLDSERNGEKPADRFPIDEEELRQRDKEAREEYEKLKKEAEQRSIEAGKKSQKAEALRIGKKAVRAVIMNLLADLIKKIIQKLIVWLKNKEKTLKSLLNSIKDAIIAFIIDLKKNVLNIADTAATVIATSILGPVIGTIKKAWMFIKQGWNSLKQSIEYIRDPKNKNKPVGILMMEVGKIILAGLTATGAIVLGEVIEKGLMTIPIFAVEIPFFGSLANVIGTFLGAVVSGIVGALAIHLINRLIAEKQKQELKRDKVEKGNDILNKQSELISLKQNKLKRTKENVSKSMSERSRQATDILKQTADEMQTSLDHIDKNRSDIERLVGSLREN